MKLSVIILMITFLHVKASSYAQMVNVKMKSASINEVFNELTQQTGYTFTADAALCKDINTISLNMSNVTLKEVLNKCFAGYRVKIFINNEDKIVVINQDNSNQIVVQAPITIMGKVTDEKGDPIPGVSVVVKNEIKKVVTNSEGKYAIVTQNSNSVLVFTFIGFKTEERIVSDNKIIDVILKQEQTGLDEVVVIGYGSVSRKDLTGSVGQVNMKDVNKAPVASIDQALAGRIAGMSVNASDGQPGSEMDIVIRGGNSLTQSNAPLYVIDGFPVEDFSLSTLNPRDVSSINVLKDASATAIYGSRGANGVIVIETKSASVGKTNVNYEVGLGFQRVTKKIDVMDPYEFVKYQIEFNPGLFRKFYLDDPGKTLEDYKDVKSYDWQDMLFQSGSTQSHNIAVSGGNNRTKLYLSGSYYDYNGVIINSGYKRAQGRAKVDHNINKALQIGINLTYSDDLNFGQLASAEQRTSKSYSSYTMYQTWGFRPLFLDDDGFDFENDVIDDDANDERVNPIISVKNEIRKMRRSTLNANGYLKYKIANGLEFLSRIGTIRDNRRNESFFNSKTARGYPSITNARGINGSIYRSDVNNLMNENTLMYKNTINKKHKYEALIGYTIQGRSTLRDGYESNQIPNEALGLNGIDDGIPVSTLSESSSNALISYLSRVNYTYANKYLFTVSMRADGSSKFSKTNRWGYFPSGAVGWKLKNEEFMKSIAFINDAKIRFSIGQTGNNRIDDYGRFSTLTMAFLNYYSFDNGIPSPSIIPNKMGNKDLKWETTTQSDLGLDLTLFKSRISIVADVYQKTTKNLLLNANIASTSGYSSVLKNIGVVQNRGLEFTLITANIDTKQFKWNTEFNISFNSNKVLELAENQESFLSKVNWTYDYNSSFLYITKVGGPATAFYGVIWDGVYQNSDFNEQGKLKSEISSNGADRSSIKAGDIKYIDVNGDGIVNQLDYVIIGRPIPIHTGGFNNNFVYKGISLNIFFQWSYGGQIFNANRLAFEGNAFGRTNLNQYAVYTNRWTPDNQTNEYFRAGGAGPTGIYSSRTIEDGSFLRLKNISFDYRFASKAFKRIGLQNLSVSLAFQNLYTWTKYRGVDPEVSVRNSNLTPGFDYSAYPMSKIIQLGVKASF